MKFEHLTFDILDLTVYCKCFERCLCLCLSCTIARCYNWTNIQYYTCVLMRTLNMWTRCYIVWVTVLTSMVSVSTLIQESLPCTCLLTVPIVIYNIHRAKYLPRLVLNSGKINATIYLLISESNHIWKGTLADWIVICVASLVFWNLKYFSHENFVTSFQFG